jgi:hypothetical protein
VTVLERRCNNGKEKLQAHQLQMAKILSMEVEEKLVASHGMVA